MASEWMNYYSKPGDGSSLWRSMSKFIAAHPRRVILFWLVLFGLAIPAGLSLRDQLPPTRSIAGTQSAYVDGVIAEKFGLDTRRSAVLVISGLRPVHDPADRDLLKAAVKSIRAWPQVVRANSIIDIPQHFMVGRDGTGALVSLQFVRGTKAAELAGQRAALEEMIATQAESFLRWLEGRVVVPTITALHGHHDRLRALELERVRKLLAGGTPPEQALELLARGLTNKFLHAPTQALNQAGDAERAELVAMFEKIYQIPDGH